MSRNGAGSTFPFFMTRMRPGCSTMNRRPDPSPAPVTKTGLFRPDAIRVSLKVPALTVAAVGDGSGGEGLGETACEGLVLAEADGLGLADCAVCCTQPASRIRATSP